ncbi:MAG: RNA polymerase sigma factor [Bacteroidota bacterium]
MKEEINIQLLLQGCLQGNRQSQRKLYEHFYGYAMNVCLRYSKNQREAAEVLNDAFLKVFTHLDRYDASYPFRAWLRRILINAAIDYYRKHHRVPDPVELTLSADRADEDLPLPQILPGEDVLPLLQKLPPAYRMVFNLHVMEEFKHHEIAEMLGISAATSRSNFLRAKQKLREILLNDASLLAGKNKKTWKIG